MAPLAVDLGTVARRVGPISIRLTGVKRFQFRLLIARAVLREDDLIELGSTALAFRLALESPSQS